MGRCAGIKRDGGRCAVVVGPGLEHCYQHDPDRADERRRNASRGGKSRATGGELPALKRQLKDLAAGVLDGTVDRGRAAVANQILSKNGLHRHYDRFTPEERFRLDVLATARGDLRESERLVNSCPRFSYTMNERGFGGRWDGAREITLRIYIFLGEQLAKLQMVGAFREMVPYQQTLSSNIAFDAYFTGHKSGSRHAWSFASKTGCPPAWPEGEDPAEIWVPDEDEQDPAIEWHTDELEATVEEFGAFLPGVLDRLEGTCVSQAFSLWAGYAAFCEGSMGVPAEKVGAVVLEP